MTFESILRLEAVRLDSVDTYFSIICVGKYRFELDHSPHSIISTLQGEAKSLISFPLPIVLGKLVHNELRMKAGYTVKNQTRINTEAIDTKVVNRSPESAQKSVLK